MKRNQLAVSDWNVRQIAPKMCSKERIDSNEIFGTEISNHDFLTSFNWKFEHPTIDFNISNIHT